MGEEAAKDRAGKKIAYIALMKCDDGLQFLANDVDQQHIEGITKCSHQHQSDVPLESFYVEASTFLRTEKELRLDNEGDAHEAEQGQGQANSLNLFLYKKEGTLK